MSTPSEKPAAPRVRIAPSPTGHLHVGTARTALYNYLYAKKHKGTFILRLEDTDEERSREEYTDDIIDGLKWLGLTWDEGLGVGGPYAPYRQTEKIDHYNTISNHLIAAGKAYLCYATTEELAALKDEQRAAGQAVRYDNRSRNLSSQHKDEHEAAGRIPSVRFMVEEPRVVSWHDGIKGEIAIDTADLGGDMVIVKSNGVAIYNFAVVVDDVDMKITHVIRGEDHIHNTAKQILIYEALGYDLPHFAHAPLMFDIERQKLSKRKHGEVVHVDYYRKKGYMPEAIINYLTQMSWTHPEGKEIYSLEEAGQLFDLDKVSKSNAVFDVDRLNWFNGHYIRSLPSALITERSLPFFTEAGFDVKAYSSEDIERIVATVREGLVMLCEIGPAVKFFFDQHPTIESELKESVLTGENARKVLSGLLSELGTLPWADHQGCKKAVDAIGKSIAIKGKELYWPVRVALTGTNHGPDLGSIISILGEKRVRERLEVALGLCSA
ncbi:MAG: glutamate--tRNA ligase [Cyanobacteria bacterium SZAS LIN-2]|nr:glutamate--tRNA ligase [Cyanobacteria bacterium SZAS LIN-2]